VLLAMLWFMPVLRGYHIIWAYPSVAVLAAAMHHGRRRRGWFVLSWVCVLLAVGAEVAGAKFELTSARAIWLHAGGILLGFVVVLALPLVVLLARGRSAADERI